MNQPGRLVRSDLALAHCSSVGQLQS